MHTCLEIVALVLLLHSTSPQFVYPDDRVCSTPGRCVNVKNCPELMRLLKQQPLQPQTVKYLQQSQCGFEGNDPKVCCQSPDKQQEPIPTPRPNPTKPTKPTQSDDSIPNVTNHPKLSLLNFNECGPINKPKIIGGNVTSIKEFPWMALLAYKTGAPNPEFRCGGSVINRRYILTAAHCVTNLPSNLRLIGVRVGEHDLTTDIDCEARGSPDEECNERHQDFGIDSVHFHPQYSSSKLHDDIALIRVNRSIDFRPDNAKPVCLPVGSAAKINSKKLTVTGWGVTETRVASPVMLKVNLPIYPFDDCVDAYKMQTKVWHKQMCMGGEQGKDSCSGDSGGPLQGVAVFANHPRYVQYGIVSFGVRNCGTEGFPGVYTRVDHYLDWILNNMKE